MKLSRFILDNTERIIADWEAFARTIVPLDSMDITGLRDHAAEMLRVIASDLETPQTGRERSDRSKGLADPGHGEAETPAQAHGEDRAESGFTLTEMLSEYRAMRASVIRLWTEGEGQLAGTDIEDLMRFNEAIDQALTESATRFSSNIAETREISLGILGHDLRTPLGAMITSAQFMLELGTLQPPADMLTGRIVTSGERMIRMIDDLLEFTRGRLGGSVPVVREELDLKNVLEDAVEELRAAHPDVHVELSTSGDLCGEWDSERLGQVLSNLLDNARSHGLGRKPIGITAEGRADEVSVGVYNDGPAIPPERLRQLLNSVKPDAEASRDPEHLGLGLYIIQRIVSAHGGTVEVRSDTSGTSFTVILPRRAEEGPAGVSQNPEMVGSIGAK